MNREIGIDIHTVPCVKQIVSETSLYRKGSSLRYSVVT